ncbi:MAG TPA: hypothetical protein VGA22_14375 [Gemmatimonadales bacterium]|jgi:hypothetical protein
MITIQRALLLAIAPAFIACAPGAGASGVPRSFSNVLTRAELDEAGARNLYDAIQRLRPRWLEVRGGIRSINVETEIVVFQEQMYLGDVDELRRMGVDGVWEVRYLDGSTAAARLPGLSDRHIEGAIVVYLTPPDRRDLGG